MPSLDSKSLAPNGGLILSSLLSLKVFSMMERFLQGMQKREFGRKKLIAEFGVQSRLYSAKGKWRRAKGRPIQNLFE